jgi:hypothetical protein
MKDKGETSADASSQLARFKEAARAIGCDESEAAFDENLRKIASQQPKPKPNTKQDT